VSTTSLLTSGCNGGSSGTGPGGGNTHGATIDACTLLTSDEAASIMGQPVVSHTDTLSKGYIGVCTYYGSVNPGAYLPTRLLIDAFTTAGMQAVLHTGTAESYVENLKTQLPSGFWISQSGVGTDAIWRNREGKLSFYKGDVAVDVIYSANGAGIDTTAAGKAGAVTGGMDAAARL